MRKNVGISDKAIRSLLAIVLMVLYLTDAVGGILGTVLLVVAFILIATSFISFCPLYAPFGISTRKKKES